MFLKDWKRANITQIFKQKDMELYLRLWEADGVISPGTQFQTQEEKERD